MREIKFRGMREDKKSWVHGSLWESKADGLIVIGWDKVIRESVGQYTGLKDKNGKEIYEMDEVRFSCIREDVNKGFVLWSEKGCYWVIKSKLPVLLGRACDIEIIGNLCENPELLEDK